MIKGDAVGWKKQTNEQGIQLEEKNGYV